MNKPIRRNERPYIYQKTAWKAIGGGFCNPKESKVIHVGRYKVRVVRSEYLNFYGNPIHTATYINTDGTDGRVYRSTAPAYVVVCECLKRNGVDVRVNKKPY